MEKDKKKTLTISTGLKKKIDTTLISSGGKKTYSIEKKKPFRANKNSVKPNLNQPLNLSNDAKKKNFAKKFI
jgi:hypothetical protein